MSVRTRVPYEPDYAALVGTAVYIFAYYEWVIIYLVQQFKPGFVARYCRGAPMTSGQVKKELQNILADERMSYVAVSKIELENCVRDFAKLVDKRNALIHAHPITDQDGSQILNYQAGVRRPLPDMKWPVAKVEAIISDFDAAAWEANELLHRFFK